MLVLSRKKEQAIIVRAPGFPAIRIVVADIRNGKVRLGFEAAPVIVIDREEVDQQKQIA